MWCFGGYREGMRPRMVVCNMSDVQRLEAVIGQIVECRLVAVRQPVALLVSLQVAASHPVGAFVPCLRSMRPRLCMSVHPCT